MQKHEIYQRIALVYSTLYVRAHFLLVYFIVYTFIACTLIHTHTHTTYTYLRTPDKTKQINTILIPWK